MAKPSSGRQARRTARGESAAGPPAAHTAHPGVQLCTALLLGLFLSLCRRALITFAHQWWLMHHTDKHQLQGILLVLALYSSDISMVLKKHKSRLTSPHHILSSSNGLPQVPGKEDRPHTVGLGGTQCCRSLNKTEIRSSGDQRRKNNQMQPSPLTKML